MTDDSKSGPKGADEVDPLSATAMFLRTLDKQSAAKPEELPAKFDFNVPEQGAGRRDALSRGSLSESDRGEFTAIFGKDDPIRTTPSSSVPPPSTPGAPFTPHQVWSDSDPAAKQGPGEFTRIFVKGASPSPKPPARPSETAPDPSPLTPARAKGFSSPGVSDAASAETSFSQFFKPAAKASAPAQQNQPPSVTPFQPVASRSSSTSEPPRIESPFGRPGNEPISSSQDPQSITSLIQSLSSPAASGGKPRDPDPAPYRPETPASFQPLAKAPAPSGFDAGGVTQFIQRLADMSPAPAVEAPSAVPVRNQDSGPGEYTRIISVPTKPLASTPAPAATPAPATPSPGFVRPVVPAMPAVPAAPPLPVMAPHAPPLAAAPPPAIPSPHLPPVPMPAAPAVAAPKGKLEALVPMMLVVNTFLLVVILVVMIFLIKSR
jgi:hypothetical protein